MAVAKTDAASTTATLLLSSARLPRPDPEVGDLNAVVEATLEFMHGEFLERGIEIDAALGLSSTSNAEIGRTWFIQVAQRRHEPAYEQMAEHLRKFGRVRLVHPVYVALAANGSDAALAKELFDSARGAYHPIANAYIDLVGSGEVNYWWIARFDRDVIETIHGPVELFVGTFFYVPQMI